MKALVTRNLSVSFVVLSGLLGLGCRGQTSREAPAFGIRNMYGQPKYDIQEESEFFPDHRTMRPLVEGVVATEDEVDPEIARGRLEDESGYVLEIPKAVVARRGGMEALLQRGQARFNIYCAPCHDKTGSGQGLVKRRAVAGGAAAFVPPTFHQDRIRHMPDGQLFATISNGKNNMPPYGMQIPVEDRWAIVSYVRALQMAQPKMAEPAAPTPTSAGPLGPAPGGSVAPTETAAPAESAAPSAAPAGSAAPAQSASAQTPKPEETP